MMNHDLIRQIFAQREQSPFFEQQMPQAQQNQSPTGRAKAFLAQFQETMGDPMIQAQLNMIRATNASMQPPRNKGE